MNLRTIYRATMPCLMLLALGTAGSIATAATFTVNSMLDVPDGSSTDGMCQTLAGACTLRAAIQQANATTLHDTIIVPAGTYILTIAGDLEDAAATGDLDITESVDIVGAGAATTIIDANQLDRVFHIVSASASTRIAGLAIQHGAASPQAGGLYNFDGGGVRNHGTLDVEDCVVRQNLADNDGTDFGAGGGIYNRGTMTLTGSTVESNNATEGGGVSNEFAGRMTIRQSTIRSNTANYIGGGIQSIAELTIIDSTINDNQAPEGGGIIHAGFGNPRAPLTVINSTVSRNTGDPGGIYNADAEVVLNGVTITENVGVGIFMYSFFSQFDQTTTLSNTVLAGNTPGGCRSDHIGPLISAGFNLIGNTTNCSLAGDPTGNQLNVPANLGPLADNGGPTRTHAPNPGSLAIDRGNNVLTPGSGGDDGPACAARDQRGTVRPISGRCDIGAVEATVCGDGVVHAPEMCDPPEAGCCIACTTAVDGDTDGACDMHDNCPSDSNPDQRDTDTSGAGDVCDACPSVEPNAAPTCDPGGSDGAVIGPGGGTIGAGQVTIRVPPGAVASPTSFSITTRSSSRYGLGSTAGNLAQVADLGPDGVTFSVPVAVELSWLDTDMDDHVDGSNTNEDFVRVWRTNPATGVPEPITPYCRNQRCVAGCESSSTNTNCCCAPPGSGFNKWYVSRTQFSEYAVGAECPPVLGAKLRLSKMAPPPGNDHLVFKGTFMLPPTVTNADLDPRTHGIRLVLDAPGANLLDVLVPAGDFEESVGRGWTVNASATRWSYKDRTASPPGDIVGVRIQDKSANIPGLIKFKFKGKNGTYGATSVVGRTIELPAVSQCFRFDFDQGLGCAMRAGGSTLSCVGPTTLPPP